MSVKLRKIDYQVHMDQLDAEGNVIGELSTSQPLSLYAHQLAELPDQVAGIVAQAEAQAEAPAEDAASRPPRTRPRR